VFAGRSASVAVAVKVRSAPALTVLFAMTASVGHSLTSLTVTRMDSKTLHGVGVPLSVTRTVIVYTPGPGASGGVKVKTPVEPLIAAPAGAPASSEKVRV